MYNLSIMKTFPTEFTVFRARQNAYGCILVGFSFLVLTLLTVRTIVPEINADAASQTASQTVGPYTMSMSNDSVATVNITPTSSQAVYTGTNNLSVTNTCPSGASITMTTNSTTSNSLTRTGTDSLTKEIAATTTTALDNNSWGYALNNSSTYYAVPKKGATAATIYNATAAQTSALSVPVKFGVKTDNNMPSGTYTNDVLYTMTPKAGCLTYSVTWDMNGGTAKSGATYPSSLSWGATIDLSTLTPTRDGYTFTGWSDGSSTYTGNSNINTSNANSVTLTAQWKSNEPTIPTGACTGSYGSQVNVNLAVNGTQNFDYTGNVQCAYLQKAGYYKLEVWGAQGSPNTQTTYDDSSLLGGYSMGKIHINESSAVYIIVGSYLGYNGGGNYGRSGGGYGNSQYGGGATHISTYNCGELKNCSSYKGTYNSSLGTYDGGSILIVAGGGGGGSVHGRYGSGGGYIGDTSRGGSGGTQISGGSGYAPGGGAYSGNNGSFGQGGATVADSSQTGGGGGGGWYGGGGGHSLGSSGHTASPGGGGSGYIGNSLLLANKGMYMYSGGCTSSTAAATKTTCTSSTGAHVANAANTGNGYAKITYLGT